MSGDLRQANKSNYFDIRRLTYHEAECAFLGSRWWKTYQRFWWTTVGRYSTPSSRAAVVALRHRHQICNLAMRLDAREGGSLANYKPLSRVKFKARSDIFTGADRVELYGPNSEQLRRWGSVLEADPRPIILAERLEAGILTVDDQSISVLPWVDRDDFNSHLSTLLACLSTYRRVRDLTYFIRIWCYPSSYMRYIGSQSVMPLHVKIERETPDAQP